MHFLARAWYQKAGWLWILWPVAKIVQIVASIRKQIQSRAAKSAGSPVPVVVVGNITVGGTGKTPLVIRLGKLFQEAGLKPGVISRGYMGKAPDYPFNVTSQSDVDEVGDEALLIVQSLQCPMVIDPDRKRALDKLCNDFECDVVLSDDGLQHYRLPRDIEIAVVDGLLLFGNGQCLPAGPLREPVSRLDSVQHVVINGAIPQSAGCPQLQSAVSMELDPTYLVNVISGERKPFRGAPFNIGTTIHAVSGVGSPGRFFELLGKLPYKLERYDFPDHHPFTEEDISALSIDDHQPIVMTEKDVVKCREFARPNFWFLAVNVKLPEPFLESVLKEVKELCAQTGN